MLLMHAITAEAAVTASSPDATSTSESATMAPPYNSMNARIDWITAFGTTLLCNTNTTNAFGVEHSHELGATVFDQDDQANHLDARTSRAGARCHR